MTVRCNQPEKDVGSTSAPQGSGFEARSIAICLLALFAVGCSSTEQLMPTPNLYTDTTVNPYAQVPPALQTNKIEVMYYTDRTPDTNLPGQPDYGYGRCRSSAFGEAVIEIGKDVSWAQLVKESRTQTRDIPLPLSVVSINEIARFQPTPPKLVERMPTGGTTRPSLAKQASDQAEQDFAEKAFRKELAARLALTPVKEVFVYIHGFNNTFYDSVIVAGEMWHTFGHRGVTIAYSWPAGSPGLFSYLYDTESSQITVYHFKQMMRLIASCPEVQKVHILAHSRGNQVLSDGMLELDLELKQTPPGTRAKLKLGTVVCAAPDVSFDLVAQRLASDRLGRLPEHAVILVSNNDKALGLSHWLLGGSMRLGDLSSGMFTVEEMAILRETPQVQIIQVNVSDAGLFNHGYFHASPAVTSDLIQLFRYGRDPGAENGRPLGVSPSGFWQIDNGYPGNVKVVQPETAPSASDEKASP